MLAGERGLQAAAAASEILRRGLRSDDEKRQGDKLWEAPFIQCPKESPCTGIDLENVEIGVKGETAKMSCAFAHGTATDVKPKSCLLPP